MALQTNVFRDGQWRTETVSLDSILQGASASTPPAKDDLPEPPPCGILTRTIVESPIAHWVLPARLRSARHNDVVFVGVSIASFARHTLAKWPMSGLTPLHPPPPRWATLALVQAQAHS